MKILKRFFGKKNEVQPLSNSDEIDWDKIDLEKVNFILQEGEKLMRIISANYDSLDNKECFNKNFFNCLSNGLIWNFKIWRRFLSKSSDNFN